MAAQFQFIVRTGPNAGKTFPLEATEVTVGRDTSNGIPINDAEVSRRHARLVWKASGYILEDLGSTNGSFVNGTRISGSIPLKPGDTVSFGENIVLLYEALGDVNATVISTSKAARTVAPVSQPPAPAPAPVYSGQVPAGPAPAAPAAPKKGKSSRVVIIVIIAVVLCLILGCVAVFLWVDADKTGARWCTFPFRYIAQLVGAVCP